MAYQPMNHTVVSLRLASLSRDNDRRRDVHGRHSGARARSMSSSWPRLVAAGSRTVGVARLEIPGADDLRDDTYEGRCGIDRLAQSYS
jgi:hypothetical protein